MGDVKSDFDYRFPVPTSKALNTQFSKENPILTTGCEASSHPVSLRIKWPLGKSTFGFLLPRPRSRGGKAIPFVRQVEPASVWTRRRLLAVYVFSAALIALVMAGGVVLSVMGRNYIADRRCLDPVALWDQTEAECGHLWRIIDRKTGSDAPDCRFVPYLVRCVVVSLRMVECPCDVWEVTRAVQSSVVTSDTERRHLVADVPNYALLTGLDEPGDRGASYRLARRNCSRMVNAIEGSTGSNGDFCHKLQALDTCLRRVLGSSVFTIGDVEELFPAELVVSATEGDPTPRCQESPEAPVTTPPDSTAPCLGVLTATETEVFVRCSSYLSLHAASNSSHFHCRLHAYMVRCIEQGLETIGSACPRSNIVRRLSTDLSRTSDLSYNSLCPEFIEQPPQRHLCHDAYMLKSITLHACAEPASLPFRLTQTDIEMSDQFARCSEKKSVSGVPDTYPDDTLHPTPYACSQIPDLFACQQQPISVQSCFQLIRFSALVTCLSEYLTTTDISCITANLENGLVQSEDIRLLIGQNFTFSQCQGPGPEGLCHDGRTLLQITNDSCNIALEFVRGETQLNYKCSYFRQFVTCAQTLLQFRGYECLFDDLLGALKLESYISRRSGLDPSLC